MVDFPLIWPREWIIKTKRFYPFSKSKMGGWLLQAQGLLCLFEYLAVLLYPNKKIRSSEDKRKPGSLPTTKLGICLRLLQVKCTRWVSNQVGNAVLHTLQKSAFKHLQSTIALVIFRTSLANLIVHGTQEHSWTKQVQVQDLIIHTGRQRNHLHRFVEILTTSSATLNSSKLIFASGSSTKDIRGVRELSRVMRSKPSEAQVG